MKKIAFIVSTILFTIGFIPAQAAETRTVSGVSAYYRADLGYLVGWTVPSDASKINNYTVTANPGGKTCVVNGGTSNKCVFTSAALGFTNTYTFSVVANSANGTGPASISNSIKSGSIPYAPQKPLAKITSDNSMDIAWVPSPNDGGASLYGYRLNVWESQANGDPGTAAFDSIVTKTNASVTGLKPSTLYVINVQSCNTYGCNSADKWTYISTTGPAGVSPMAAPIVISGGNANTTCWNRTWDAGMAADAGSTVTKSAYTCPETFVDPSNYPKIVPANNVNTELATKFAQTISFRGFAKTYSMAQWSKGVSWFSYLGASSKAVTLGFTIAPNVTSNTPAVCKIESTMIKLLSPGICSISASIGGNGIWKATDVATTSFVVIQ